MNELEQWVYDRPCQVEHARCRHAGLSYDCTTTGLFGHWRWSETMACHDGPDVTKRGPDRLVFTAPGSVFVHVLAGAVADGPEKGRVRTTIEEPEALKGTRYELRLRDSILDVQQIGEQRIDTWTRCTL